MSCGNGQLGDRKQHIRLDGALTKRKSGIPTQGREPVDEANHDGLILCRWVTASAGTAVHPGVSKT